MRSMGSTGISWKETFSSESVLSTEFIRNRIETFVTNDHYNRYYLVEARFRLNSAEPILKATGTVSYLEPLDYSEVFDERQFMDMCEKLVDVLIHKVKTYYEGRAIIKEEKNMPIYMNNYDLPDELKKMFGLTAKGQDNKPEWIEGLPAVANVEIYNDRAIKMTFIDGTFTKAVCSENDNFDLDVGITICAMKRLLGTNSDNATKMYNRFIRHVHSVMEKNALEEVAEEARKAKEKSRRRKAELKRAAKKLKAREEQIDIQKQAIIRAQKELEAMGQ